MSADSKLSASKSSNILFTMAEDLAQSNAQRFGIKYSVDEHDCLHFAEGLRHLGHQIYFVNWQDLEASEALQNSEDGRSSQSVSQFKRMYSFNKNAYLEPLTIEDFDLVFVYKMEGFYFERQKFEAMLKRFAGVTTVNDTRTILHNMDKSYTWQLAKAGIKVIPSFTIEQIAERLAAQPEQEAKEIFVIKPLHGERGSGIFLARSRADLQNIKGKEYAHFAQTFMPEIRDGERSLVFLGREYQHAVIKHPSKTDTTEFRCNESLGGTVEVYEPTVEEIEFCGHVLNAYEKLGYPVHFSRIDILATQDGPTLLEAELLNPSIYANYSNKGKEFGSKIAHYFDNLIAGKRQTKLAGIATSNEKTNSTESINPEGLAK